LSQEILDANIGTERPDLVLQLPAALPTASSSSTPETQLLLARPEAIYHFSCDSGRGTAWFVSEGSGTDNLGPGEKERLGWYRGYFALVTKYPVLSRTEQGPGSLAKSSTATEPEGEKAVSVLTLYDLRNKFISFSGVFTNDGGSGAEDDFTGAEVEVLAANKEMRDKAVGISVLWSQWGFLWVITEDHRVGL
jgi:hypothetical protein